jgi:Na+-driven multidrug efflux pump
MSLAVKAFLLSALVFPGLGQLYKQDRAKGVLLILLANLLLGVVFLSGMIHFSQEYMAAFFPEPLTLDLVRPLLKTVFSRPLFLAPFLALAALWAFAAVDAGLKVPPPSEED